MITLQCYAPSFGEISASPFSAKSIYMMTYAKMDWVRENLTDPRSAPLGKLPVAHYDGRIIHDSDNIRALIESFGVDFDKGLSGAERGCARAFIRMAEEHLYFHQVHDRWINDDIWPIVKKEYFGFLPPVVRNLVPNTLRKNLRRGLMAQGTARFSDDERIDRARIDFTAIEQQLGSQPFCLALTQRVPILVLYRS